MTDWEHAGSLRNNEGERYSVYACTSCGVEIDVMKLSHLQNVKHPKSECDRIRDETRTEEVVEA